MKTKKVTKNFFVPENFYEQSAKNAYDAVVENFPKTFFVGGMVRDLLLSKKISDIDIATSAKPDEIINTLKGQNFKLDLEAKRFGVISIIIGKHRIEITTFRNDLYDNSRYPKISFVKTPNMDSKRRDFTINALYFQGKSLTIYDYTSGFLDLSKKLIRLIGEPGDRIQEDPLRIIRAYRFKNQLHFTFEKKTEQAIKENLNLLSKLTTNKIYSEFKKIKSKSSRQDIEKNLHNYLQIK